MPTHIHAATLRTRDLLVANFGSVPFTHADLVRVGITRGQLRATQNQGLVSTVHRGLFVVQGLALRDSGQDAARAAIKALEGIPAVIAGRVAGQIHATPFITPRRAGFQREVTEVLVPRESMCHMGRRMQDVIVRPVDTLPHDVVLLEGLPVTSPLHTAVDLVRMGLRPHGSVRAHSLPLPEALVVLDATSRRLGDVDSLQAQSRFAGIRPRFRQAQGIRALDAAIPFVDPRAESPLESWSRGYMIVHGIPLPLLQEILVGADGIGYRVDFCWPAARLIGEADGLAKYGDDATAFRRAKVEEVARQRALERRGWRFARWTWDDMACRPEEVMDDLHRALASRPLVA